MLIGFPPTPVYPKGLDSDETLFLVYNTSEAVTTSNNNAWAEEINIEPVSSGQLEIWANNGFANVNGELFYYDDVGYDGNGKVNTLKRCARNIGGTKTKFNEVGSWVRGFVVAQHHNQLVNAIMATETFIGAVCPNNPNIIQTESLDCRIRKLLNVPDVIDDNNCATVEFSFNINTAASATSGGIVIDYSVLITGNATNFYVDFGDGNTSTTATGNHTYAINAIIDPVVVVSNNNCEITQTIISRTITTQPSPSQASTSLQIPLPELPIFPTINIPNISIPSTTLTLPPIVFPCLDIGNIGPINIPSVITVNAPPITIPSLIEFGPFPNFPSFIEILVPSIPPLSVEPISIDIGPIDIPSVISIVGDFFVSLPDFNINTNISIEPFDISIEVSIPPIDVNAYVSISPIDIDINISIDPLDLIVSVEPVSVLVSIPDFMANVSIENISIDVNIPTISTEIIIPSIDINLSITPISIELVVPSIDIYFNTDISIEPIIIDISLEPIDIVVSIDPITIDISIPSFPVDVSIEPINVIVSIPSIDVVASVEVAVPVSVADITVSTMIQFPDTIPPISVEFPSQIQVNWGVVPVISIIAPQFEPISILPPDFVISVDWGNVPTISGVIQIQCNTSTMSAANPFAMGSNEFNEFQQAANESLQSPVMEMGFNDLGIPSEIKIVSPNIPNLQVIHDLPSIIRFESINMPSIINVVDTIPHEIKILNTIPEFITISSDIIIPSSIKVESNIPEFIKIEIPEFPRISFDTTGIPNSIKVEGIPDTIKLIGTIPSEIYIRVPDNLEIPLVFKGGPIPMAPVTFDIKGLNNPSDGDENNQCFAIVPCPRK